MAIDTHCHILPGVDDGAETLEQSVAMARTLAEQGFSAVIATPHVMDQAGYRHSRESIRAKTEELNHALSSAGLSIQVFPGAEYYLHTGLPDLLKLYHPLSTMAGGFYVLVELPVMHLPPYLEYSNLPRPADPPELRKTLPYLRPVIAHPERNSQVLRDVRCLLPLRQRGYYFQVNLESLLGWGGKPALKTMKKMAKAGLIDLVGSDGHHPAGLAELLPAWRKKVEKILGRDLARRVLEENPERVLRNQPLETEE